MPKKKYSPRPENKNLRSRRPLNKDLRDREYLTYDEVQALIRGAGMGGRNQVRDEALLLLMFRHGLRAQEAAQLKWEVVFLHREEMKVNRLKGSKDGVHPLKCDEIDLLAVLKDSSTSPYVFSSETGGTLSTPAIARIVRRAASDAKLAIKVHPHMLRHACGYYLANDLAMDTRLIQAWLGHSNIQHTVKYTELNPERFKEITW